MRILSLILLSLILLSSCKQRKNGSVSQNKADKFELMEVDKAFSKLSEEKGMKAAFIEYIDSNGVMLRPGMLPLTGANAIDFLISQNDADFIMSWNPRGAAIAESGELGYTYGLYTLQSKINDSAQMGTYVTIWKKQSDGGWKFVLDSGNDGLGEIIASQ